MQTFKYAELHGPFTKKRRQQPWRRQWQCAHIHTYTDTRKHTHMHKSQTGTCCDDLWCDIFTSDNTWEHYITIYTRFWDIFSMVMVSQMSTVFVKAVRCRTIKRLKIVDQLNTSATTKAPLCPLMIAHGSSPFSFLDRAWAIPRVDQWECPLSLARWEAVKPPVGWLLQGSRMPDILHDSQSW